jgi:drug/metabolite transporter (DMT)-like permease
VLEKGAYGHDPARGTIYALAAGVAYVGLLLLLRRAGADLRRPAGPLFDSTATATLVAVIIGVLLGDADLAPDWPGAGWLITLALTSQVLGWLLITVSLPRLPAALTSLLLMIQPVGSVGFAALILGESPSTLQLVGVAVVLAALFTATYRGRGTTPVRRLAYAIAGASGSRSSAAAMSSSENSKSSSRPARNAS